MFLVQHLRNWATRRRLTAGVLLVVSCAMLFPLSLQVAAPDSDVSPASKDCSAPFPCQDRRCGCRSAQQCWKQCCCFTNAQKLAWAKANGVNAPAFVAVAAKREASAGPANCKAKNLCCQTGAAPRRARGRVQLVVGVDALRCQGVEQSVTGQLICIPPPLLTGVVILDFETSDVVARLESPPTPFQPEPPTPPPRLLTV